MVKQHRLFLVLMSLFGAVLGAIESTAASSLDPAAIKVKGIDFIPTLSLEQSYLDNLLSQPDNPLSSGLTVVNPGLQVKMQRDSARLLIDLNYEGGRFNTSSEDNYDDKSAFLAFDLGLNGSHQVGLTSSLKNIHEARGTGYSQGPTALLLESPDTFRHITHQIQYRYGAPGGAGRLIFKADKFTQRATSRQAAMAVNDYDRSRLSSALFWRFGGYTDAVLEVRQATIDYIAEPTNSAFGTLDSVGTQYFVGLNWELTGKTNGSILLGHAVKGFDSPLREDFSGFTWEAKASWTPRSYSKFTLSTSQGPRETDGLGSFIEATDLKLEWQHKWSDKGQFEIYTAFEDIDYVGSLTERAESQTLFGIDVSYAIRRWVEIGVDALVRDKTSSLQHFEYDANRIGFYVTWSL